MGCDGTADIGSNPTNGAAKRHQEGEIGAMSNVIDMRDAFEKRRRVVERQRYYANDLAQVDAAVSKFIDRLMHNHHPESIAQSFEYYSQDIFKSVGRKTL
jgi:hypothetical protein